MPAIAASVALVPFENLSGDPAQDVLARGFVEDIASALSRFGMLEVVYPRALATASAARAGDDPTSMATTLVAFLALEEQQQSVARKRRAV